MFFLVFFWLLVETKPVVQNELLQDQIIEAMSSPAVRTYAREKVDWPAAGTVAWRDIPSPDEYRDVVAKGELAVPILIDLLNNQDGDIRVAAWLALKDVTNRTFRSLHFFRSREAHAEKQRREAQQEWLSWWDENGKRSRIEWLLEDLNSTNAGRRWSAVVALGLTEEPAVVPSLRGLLKDPDEAIRVATAEALGRLGDRKAIPSIVELLLQDSRLEVRETGIRLLVEMTGIDLGYEARGDDDERRAAVARWQEWGLRQGLYDR